MEEKKVKFVNSAGKKLSGKLFTPKGFKHTIVISNGIGTVKERWEGEYFAFVQGFVALGYRVLTFDYTGRGESEGKYTDTTLTTNIDDLNTAIDFLNDKSIILLGESFGGEAAIYIAANDRRVKALITFYAPLNMLGWEGGKRYKIAKKNGFFVGGHGKYMLALFEDDASYDLKKEIPKIKCPWLIFHGEADKYIAVSNALDGYKLATCKKKLVIYKGEKEHVFQKKTFAKSFLEIKKFLASTKRNRAL